MGTGGGHGGDRAAGRAGEGGDRERAGGGRADQVEVAPPAVGCGGGGDGLGEGRLFRYGVEKAVQAHEVPSGGFRGVCGMVGAGPGVVGAAAAGNANRPARAAGRGFPGYAPGRSATRRPDGGPRAGHAR